MAFIGQRRHCLRTGAISRQQQDHVEYRQWVLPQDYLPYLAAMHNVFYAHCSDICGSGINSMMN